MKNIEDKNGWPVNKGALVKVLHIDEAVFNSVPDDEKQKIESMLNEVLEVYEIDEYGQAWVDKEWNHGAGRYESHSLGLSSHEMELVYMKRKMFLNEFLGALGAKEIIYSSETNKYIAGTVIYEQNNPDEPQEFCWHIKEIDVPNDSVLNLAKLLNGEHLLSIDRIILSRVDLLKKYNEKYRVSLLQAEFNSILDILESIEVAMVDNGKETDAYFIHE